jgi:enediyne polyketide synthase
MQDGFAIVGMACRYPDADDPGQLWENVLAQRRSFRRIPDQRLNRNDYVSDDRDDPDKTYSGKAAVLCGWEFDRHRFRTAGQTFRSADMAHWLALEIAADALADAGFPDGRGLPKVSTGVLVGNSLTGEFSRANLMRLRWPYVARVVDSALRDRDWSPQDRGRFLGEIEQTYKSAFPPVVDETLAGGLSNTIAGRICNHFDLHGGGYTIDGACASSLLTVSNACSSLAAEDTDVVLAGGVDLSLDPFELVGFSKLGALASTQMLVFDSRSNGFWPGEGCGFVVLMRQEDAVRQRRRIYAVIRGWGISSDGSGGITRPETEGQLLCLQRAYRRAGYGADSVGYFEGHGTGTPVGDATELRTLSRARCDDGASGVVPAAVGSIKANIGHTKAASGVAGLIKAAMSVDRQLIPPTTGWETPNPVIQQDGNVLQLLHESRTWSADAPIRASVSGMGFGGINAHVTLEGITPRRRSRIRRDEQCLISSMQDCDLFLFAADTRSDLKDQVDHVLGFAARLSQAELGDLAAELSKRLHFGAIRAAITASTPDELEAAAKQLSQWLADEDEPNQLRWDRSLHAMVSGNITPPTIGFLFPGQGFLPSIDGGIWRRRFESVADDYANFDLPQDVDLVETQHAQAAIVAAELAGLRLLSELDVQADVAIGHSLGELSAYHWAGAYDANTLLRLADLRGEVMSDHGRKGGAMASLTASVETVNALIGGNDVAIAGINAPQQTVVSGAVDAVTEAVERAKQQGISATILTVSHAFHSPLMADAEPVFRELLGEFEFSELRGKVLSTISGECLGRDTELRSLLSRQLTSPVRFVDAIRQADDVGLWIEVGPGQILSNLASQSVDVPTVSVDSSGARLRGLLDAVALAFTLGVNVRHQAIFADRFTRPFDLQWAPSFLTNPCEQAPESSTRIESPENVTSKDDRNQHVAAPPEAISPLDCIRDLAAQRAELPLDDVQPDDRLLNDLHLSSIAVGQLVVDATKRLGLSPPSQPTDAANATIADIADYLRQLLEQGSAGAASKKEEVPAGLESWTRQFIVRLEERERRAESATSDHGDWTILSDQDDPLTVSLRQAFSQSAGSGVVVCVPRVLGSRQLDMLLAGARRAIQSGSHHRFVLVQRHDDLRSDTGVAPFARSLHL